jgi:hypothetical protein
MSSRGGSRVENDAISSLPCWTLAETFENERIEELNGGHFDVFH